MNKELVLRKLILDNRAIDFCNLFEKSNLPKYILGRNKYTLSIIKNIKIDGVIDDFTSDTIFENIPITKIENIPNNALVIISSLCKPFTAEKRVSKFQFCFLDYYSFFKHSSLPNLKGVEFWEGVDEDLKSNKDKYNNIYKLLSDNESRNQYYNLLNFKKSYNLKYMRGFKDLENLQYFEEFLNLNKKGEVFIDVGGYDGYTSEEFIKKCPEYSEVHIFEPEESNINLAKKRLQQYSNINFHHKGLSSQKKELKFDISGSSSRITENGEVTIQVDRLDDLKISRVTFVKMDIEGAEYDAIEGAKETILKNHPKLAICIYHRKDDFWKIPELVLSIRNDYNIYLRHYSEGFSETVMFFIPKI